ncbi:MAG: MinD/ParA family protein [Treponema sp.]|jgi:flagellar biosynthesis protein FlhG|nr:MinD/ParA family protein [Treponema sp.]
MEDQAERLREIVRQRGPAGTGGDGFSGGVFGSPGGSSFDAPTENGGQSGKDTIRRFSGREGRARIITVTSGKGGVGKTNLSVNLALAYARMGKKVVVMDADLGLANVNVILNVIPKYNLYHVIRKQKTMQEILVETDYGISIVPGASGFSQIANMTDDERQNFIHELETLALADIIIIDTSAGVSSNVMDFIAAADDAIIVTTPEPTAITDAYGIIKIIATEYDNPNMGLKLVVNRVKSVAEAKKVADRMTGIAGQFLNLKVDYLGFIYDDAVVSHAVLRQKPFMAIDPRCKASLCVQHIVGRLEKSDFKESGGFAGMIKRFFGRN